MARRLLTTLIACLALCVGCVDESDFEGSPRKVYVILGFHSNFYHSWRGDTPDEAGFGTDIRMVWHILRMLDMANHDGLQAVAYWDTDNLFTLETILPLHAQQIIRGMQRRVELGLDEVLPAPYDNGLFGAMTEEEVRAAVRWSISNPWGSGVLDLFGTYTPLIRPNEAMTTTGLAPLLLEEGIEGIVLAYSGWPFNGFSTFVPTLPPEQRYNPTWLRLEQDGPRLVLFPCVSIGDVLNMISLERWMLDLRELQVSGEVDRDLVIHINFDSDVDTWLPREMPPGLGWFPNSGGLPEYIRAVNKYDWAEFTTPGRYLADHEPVGEVLIRRDLADGSFDGHASWAEKLPSHAIWTALEGSRLATERAEALALTAPEALREQTHAELWEGRDSSFFQRLRGLSTTHFGMSTPLVNEERQAVAEAVVGAARDRAVAAERRLAEAVAAAAPPRPADAVYAFEVRDLRVKQGRGRGAVRTLLRIPLLLPYPLPPLALVDEGGERVPASIVNLDTLPGGLVEAELWFALPLAPAEVRRVALVPAAAWADARAGVAPERLASGALELDLAAGAGIASLRLGDWQVGGADFVEPFVTYRSADVPVTRPAGPFELLDLEGEQWEGLTRARLRTAIPFETPDGEAEVSLRADLSLLEGAPWIVADVEVAYPYTEKRDLLHTMQQKLRRTLDLRWIEVAPFPLRPRFEATRAEPITIWKHNWLGVSSSYPLDYARINPRNAELDAFNHQVTAGWVAASDGSRGLLLAYDATRRASHAFAPMRLRERDGRQVLQINPFGSYHGRQLDYSHLGGTGVGTAFTTLGSSALRPNAPSYDGETERFSLLLAPYRGDAPPAALRAEAEAFFHPPAVVVLRAPRQVAGARLASDLRAAAGAARLAEARLSRAPLPAPRAFLVNPTEGAVDLVWDEPRDVRVEGYDVEWRAADAAGDAWQRAAIGRGRRHRVDGLPDGSAWAFRVRARGAGLEGPWSPVLEATVGPVEKMDTLSAVEGAPFSLLLRTFYYGLVHALTTP
jgi:hypothetical protein